MQLILCLPVVDIGKRIMFVVCPSVSACVHACVIVFEWHLEKFVSAVLQDNGHNCTKCLLLSDDVVKVPEELIRF